MPIASVATSTLHAFPGLLKIAAWASLVPAFAHKHTKDINFNKLLHTTALPQDCNSVTHSEEKTLLHID